MMQQEKLNTWVWPSVAVTLLCCLPLGIVGIVQGSAASSAAKAGNMELARQKSASAKKWALSGLIFGILAPVVLVALMFFGLLSFAALEGLPLLGELQEVQEEVDDELEALREQREQAEQQADAEGQPGTVGDGPDGDGPDDEMVDGEAENVTEGTEGGLEDGFVQVRDPFAPLLTSADADSVEDGPEDDGVVDEASMSDGPGPPSDIDAESE